MSTRHSHRRIYEEQLYENPEATFKQGRHNSRNLADLIISFSKHRGSSLSDLQKSPLHSFYTKADYDLRDHIQFSIAKVVSVYFSLFDDLFFFGSVRDRCNLALDREESSYTGSRGQMTLIGTEVRIKRRVLGLVEKKVGEQRWTIVLNPPREEFPGRYAMIHAFLELWTCDHKGCIDGFEKLGKTRHGKVWQEVALAIEDSVRDAGFLNLDLYMNRETSLALEIVTSDEDVREPYLRRWGMKRADVDEAVRILIGGKERHDDCSIVTGRSGAKRKLG
jgi:hypothetical protein